MENQEKNSIDTQKLLKDLEGFVVSAKSDLEKAQELSAKIVTKTEEVELYYGTFSELRTKLSDGTTGLQALLDQSTNLKNQIETAEATAKTHLDQITEKVNSTGIKIQEMETFYGTFSELRTKLSDGTTGLQALLDQSTNLKNQIETAEATAKTHLEQITEKFTLITIKAQEMEDFYTTTFVPLRDKINDEKDGLSATLTIAQNIREDLTKVKVAGTEDARQIKNIKENSEQLKITSEKTKNEIEDLRKKSEDFKNNIAETLHIVTDSSLANSFKNRKDELEKEKEKWLTITNWSYIAITVLVIGIFCSQYLGDISTHDWRFWYRFAFTSPLIFYIYFANKSYNEVRSLLEKYAFKYALSLSLQSYTKLLNDTFPEKEYKVDLIKFSLKSIETVYKEPYSPKERDHEIYGGFKNVFNFGFKNKNSNKENGAVSETANEDAI